MTGIATIDDIEEATSRIRETMTHNMFCAYEKDMDHSKCNCTRGPALDLLAYIANELRAARERIERVEQETWTLAIEHAAKVCENRQRSFDALKPNDLDAYREAGKCASAIRQYVGPPTKNPTPTQDTR